MSGQDTLSVLVINKTTPTEKSSGESAKFSVVWTFDCYGS